MKKKIILFILLMLISISLVSCKGNKNNGKNGEQGAQGEQGTQGEKGADGHSPVIKIGENGNWFIDDKDTHVYAGELKKEERVYTLSEDGKKLISKINDLDMKSLEGSFYFANETKNWYHIVDAIGDLLTLDFDAHYDDGHDKLEIYGRDKKIIIGEDGDYDVEFDAKEEIDYSFEDIGFEGSQENCQSMFDILGIKANGEDIYSTSVPIIKYVLTKLVKLADINGALIVNGDKYTIDVQLLAYNLYNDINEILSSITPSTKLKDVVQNGLVRKWIEPLIDDISPKAINEKLPTILREIRDYYDRKTTIDAINNSIKLISIKPNDGELTYDYLYRLAVSDSFKELVGVDIMNMYVIYDTYEIYDFLEEFEVDEKHVAAYDYDFSNSVINLDLSSDKLTLSVHSDVLEDYYDYTTYIAPDYVDEYVNHYYYSKYVLDSSITFNNTSKSFVNSTPCKEHKLYYYEKESSCTDGGYKGYFCLNCGYREGYYSFSKLDHYYESSFVKATCTEPAYTLYTCSYCGATRKESIGSPTGHIYNDVWTVDVYPTDVTNGSMSHHCINCGSEKDNTSISASNLEFELSYLKDYYIVKGIGACASAKIFIPSTYKGLPVTKIGVGAFKNQTQITNVYIPNSVDAIYARAFYGCTGLTDILISENIKYIGDEALKKTGLKKVYYYSNYSIGCLETDINELIIGSKYITGTYYGNTVTKLTILDGVESIANYVFKYLENVSSVEIPSSVSYVGPESFSYNTMLYFVDDSNLALGKSRENARLIVEGNYEIDCDSEYVFKFYNDDRDYYITINNLSSSYLYINYGSSELYYSSIAGYGSKTIPVNAYTIVYIYFYSNYETMKFNFSLEPVNY